MKWRWRWRRRRRRRRTATTTTDSGDDDGQRRRQASCLELFARFRIRTTRFRPRSISNRARLCRRSSLPNCFSKRFVANRRQKHCSVEFNRRDSVVFVVCVHDQQFQLELPRTPIGLLAHPALMLGPQSGFWNRKGQELVAQRKRDRARDGVQCRVLKWNLCQL